VAVAPSQSARDYASRLQQPRTRNDPLNYHDTISNRPRQETLMGLLYKALVPRPVKRVRRTVTRAAHPVRTVRRAVTPRAVSAAMNPVSYTKGAVENQLLRGARGGGRSRTTQRGGSPRSVQIPMRANLVGTIALIIIVGDFILSVYAGIANRSFGSFIAGLVFGLIILGVFASKVKPVPDRPSSRR
jgi:hypothetical protein